MAVNRQVQSVSLNANILRKAKERVEALKINFSMYIYHLIINDLKSRSSPFIVEPTDFNNGASDRITRGISLDPIALRDAKKRAKELQLNFSTYIYYLLRIDLEKRGSLTIDPSPITNSLSSEPWH